MNIFGDLLGGGLDFMVSGALASIGMKLKNKDTNTTGADDAAGNALIAMAPLVPAIIHGDVKGQKKVLDTTIAALQSYRSALGE